MNIVIETALDEVSRHEVQELITSTKSDLGEIIKMWVREGQTLVFLAGFDDDRPELRRAYLLFERGRKEIAAAYIPTAESEILVGSLKEFIVPDMFPPGDRDSRGRDKNDRRMDACVERRNELLGEEYCEELSCCVYSMEDALKVILGYALATRAEVTLGLVPEFYMEEMENPDFNPADFVYADGRNSELKDGLSIFETFAIRRDEQPIAKDLLLKDEKHWTVV